MTPDPTKFITDVRAAFPLGEASPAAVRDLVTNALTNAASKGGVPIWTLPAAQSETVRELRLRRMALLFLLGLPGQVECDIDAERILQDAPSDSPYSVDEIVHHVQTRRETHGPVTEVTVFADGAPGGRLSAPGYVVTERPDSGEMNVANLFDEPMPLPDGTIVVASDDPVGPFDPTSDNDMLPGLTTIWFAPK